MINFNKAAETDSQIEMSAHGASIEANSKLEENKPLIPGSMTDTRTQWAQRTDIKDPKQGLQPQEQFQFEDNEEGD